MTPLFLVIATIRFNKFRQFLNINGLLIENFGLENALECSLNFFLNLFFGHMRKSFIGIDLFNQWTSYIFACGNVPDLLVVITMDVSIETGLRSCLLTGGRCYRGLLRNGDVSFGACHVNNCYK